MVDGRYRIGDEVYVHGYIDEIRGETVIIRNNGGYFGTAESEVYTIDRCDKADRKDEPSDWETEKRENSLCYKCVKECDRRALNRYTIECNQYEPKDEPQTDGYISGEDFLKMFGYEPQTDCAWGKGE